jgi:hypothetical protein
MYFKSKKISLLILAITSVACSRTMFLFFNDPEGPNLLVVVGMASVIFFLSWATYLYEPSSKVSLAGLKGLLIAILAQIIIASVLYFCLS